MESPTFYSLKDSFAKKATIAKRGVRQKEILFLNTEESSSLKIRRECIVMVWSKKKKKSDLFSFMVEDTDSSSWRNAWDFLIQSSSLFTFWSKDKHRDWYNENLK